MNQQKEDIPSFDYSGAVVGNKQEVATLYGKSEGVLAGVPFVNAIFQEVGCTVTWYVTEGTHFAPNPQGVGREKYVKIAEVRGAANSILQGERIALNLLANASGIALKSKRMSDIAKSVPEFKGCIAATRKTTPGFRLVQKYAVLVGGCDGHRMDLSSMIMLKDNAIESCGSISKAVERARSLGGFALKIEVESRSWEEAVEAARSGADIVMLDNFTASGAKDVAQRLKLDFPKLMIEVSGGVTESTLAEYLSADIDVVSTSTLIQGVSHVDFSLKIINS